MPRTILSQVGAQTAASLSRGLNSQIDASLLAAVMQDAL